MLKKPKRPNKKCGKPKKDNGKKMSKEEPTKSKTR
jgi:hypothetical protein